MYRWIYFAIFILVHSPAVLGLDRILEIKGSQKNPENPVWIRDHVEIVARGILVFKWYFNNATIAELVRGSSYYNYPNTSALTNITARPGEIDASLTLGNVNRVYTGIYKAEDEFEIYSLHMIVHEVNLSSIEFNLVNDSDSCRAYLFINDFVDPLNFGFYRTVNSSDLTFTFTNSSNITSFEIVDSRLNITNNPINTGINIQYTFISNNFSTAKLENILLNVSLIKQPNVKTTGTPGNCTVLIQHNTGVKCVRNITYCLNTNDTELGCNVSSNLNNLTLEYPLNSTFANLSIIYDIIYVKYHFNIDIVQCTTEVATSVEPTTINSSPSEITTIQSGTSDATTSEGMTNHSDDTYSSISPSLFLTDLDTTSSELPNVTLSPTMNITGPSYNPEPLAGWIIALIVVGSVIVVLLLGGGIGFFVWKKKSMKTFGNGSFRATKLKPTDPDIPLEVQPSSNEHVVRKSIPAQHNQRQPAISRTLSTSSEHDERQQRRYERRQPQSSNYDRTIRPTIPQPPSKSSDPSSQQEARHKKRQAYPIDNEQFPRPSPDLIHQQQIPRDRRRRLPSIAND